MKLLKQKVSIIYYLQTTVVLILIIIRMHITFLPPHSPDLNPIEERFSAGETDSQLYCSCQFEVKA